LKNIYNLKSLRFQEDNNNKRTLRKVFQCQGHDPQRFKQQIGWIEQCGIELLHTFKQMIVANLNHSKKVDLLNINWFRNG